MSELCAGTKLENAPLSVESCRFNTADHSDIKAVDGEHLYLFIYLLPSVAHDSAQSQRSAILALDPCGLSGLLKLPASNFSITPVTNLHCNRWRASHSSTTRFPPSRLHGTPIPPRSQTIYRMHVQLPDDPSSSTIR